MNFQSLRPMLASLTVYPAFCTSGKIILPLNIRKRDQKRFVKLFFTILMNFIHKNLYLFEQKEVIPLKEIQSIQKKNFPLRHGVEITKKNEKYFFSNFLVSVDEIFNVIEYLYVNRLKNDLTFQSIIQVIGKVKFPDVYAEMQKRFEGLIAENEGLLDNANSSVYSVGAIQIAIGKG